MIDNDDQVKVVYTPWPEYVVQVGHAEVVQALPGSSGESRLIDRIEWEAASYHEEPLPAEAAADALAEEYRHVRVVREERASIG